MIQKFLILSQEGKVLGQCDAPRDFTPWVANSHEEAQAKVDELLAKRPDRTFQILGTVTEHSATVEIKRSYVHA